MPLARTAKAISRRLDWNYINRPDRARRIRRITILVCCLATMIIGGIYARHGDATPLSPGPLSSVHAMWDGNNCAVCHTPKEGGGFSNAVSDAACLKCHTASIHHPNQKSMVSAAVAGGEPAMSANCVSCHIEHRGHASLTLTSDVGCTQCHANLIPDTRNGSAAVKPDVVAFAAGSHPAFGRSLTDSKQWSASTPVLRDPTPLKFNHEKHQNEAVGLKPLPGQTENCTVCHKPSDDSSKGGKAYLAPISFQRDCASCHQIALDEKGLLKLPHERMELVRPALSVMARDPTSLLIRGLNAMPEAARQAELVTIRKVKASPTSSKMIEKKVTQTPEEWAKDALAKLADRYPGPAEGQLDAAALEPFLMKQDRKGGKSYGCSLCHQLTDDAAAVKQFAASAGPPMNADAILYGKSMKPPESQPATASVELPVTRPAGSVETLPTGYGNASRRWFIHGRFDHGAHQFFDAALGRNLACMDCHAQAKVSKETSDVLLPNLESCTRCHAPKTAAAGGAGTNCLLCHDYHDKTRERGPLAGHLP